MSCALIMIKVTKSRTLTDKYGTKGSLSTSQNLKMVSRRVVDHFISLNGCHLKESLDNVLLSIVTLDSN